MSIKFRVLSDLHMEGFSFKYEDQGEDVVILAGDIHTKNRHSEIIEQIEKDILFVPGNHEYYNGDFAQVNEGLMDLQNKYPHFKVLLNQSLEIDDICIYGGTCFSDFYLHGYDYVANELAKETAQHYIADFRFIKTEGRLWTVEDHLKQHRNFIDDLKVWLKFTEGRKRMVISHFVPTGFFVHPKFANSSLNPYFMSNLEHHLGWDGYWVCGHTHDSINGVIGETKIICNPRGYGRENEDGFNPNLIIEY